MNNTRLHCQDLDVSVAGTSLVNALDLQLAGGELVAIIGCNGAGKTTLLHTIAGLHGHDRPIRIGSHPLSALSRREVAVTVALLMQGHDDAFPMSVRECVAAGRHPHRAFLGWQEDEDAAVIDTALDAFDLVELAQRDVQTLSGGERQRVALAAVTAQQPQIYLLDEPLNNLDPRHQLAAMQAMRSRCDDGAAVLAVIHDLNLVARFADRVLMLFGPAADAAWYAGATATAMTADRLSELYRTPIRVHAVSDGTVFTAI